MKTLLADMSVKVKGKNFPRKFQGTILVKIDQKMIAHTFTGTGDGLGSTPNMCKKNLIWVMTKVQMVVDRYPSWGDVVQIDTRIASSGKNGMHCNWMFRDCETGEILIRVASFWAMMNKETRRLSKFPDEVRVELKQYLMDTPPHVEEVIESWPSRNESIANNTRYGLTPRWSDLDINQHVNNVKYIGWILESVPMPILENYELSSMTLEYRRECKKDSVLQSQTYVLRNDENGEIAHDNHVYCQHVLQLDDGDRGSGSEIMKGKTKWRSKYGSN
ncbi:acyl-ACP thioesterase, HotDog domain protein [Artemisia annua]|uniref:Acyl-[acyl-carrier-protein] hydrolase n=1 Tax=Artemisia annua TaxID=35608 RepID=A0A2U1NB67_ARTAN|nr:acyl-ACP thioesterase, HotDog domain protein [Artemisia annua]